MSDWVHFIGRGYYSKETFIAEAEGENQVSRRTDLRHLSSFNWGDRIFVAMGDAKSKKRQAPFDGSRVFGFFTVDRISGLTEEATEALKGKFPTAIVTSPMDGNRVERGCGSYDVVRTVQVTAPFQNVATAIYALHLTGMDVGRLLLAGEFHRITPIAHLTEFGFRMGYKHFEGFWDAYQTAFNQWASDHSGETGNQPEELDMTWVPAEGLQVVRTDLTSGQLQQVADYLLKGEPMPNLNVQLALPDMTNFEPGEYTLRVGDVATFSGDQPRIEIQLEIPEGESVAEILRGSDLDS